MKQFKKRTIALVLASVVTVIGAFGAENYKNSLMSLEFDENSGGAVSLTLHTKREYSNVINPIKKDTSTYVIMLPETNAQMVSSPTITGNIESVDIKTMPYTTSSKGYTKITIKTAPNTLISAKKTIYIPSKEEVKKEPTTTELVPEVQKNTNSDYTDENNNYHKELTSNTIHSSSGVEQINPVDIKQSMKQFESQPTLDEQKTPVGKVKSETKTTVAKASSDEQSSEALMIILSVFLVIVLVVYFYIKGKNKMSEILGEQTDFSIDDEQPKKNKEKNSKREKIRKTINHLDKMYSKPSSILQSKTEIPLDATETDDAIEYKNNVVDLDELFQEKISQNTDEDEHEENSALDEFLSAYSFDIEDVEPEKIFDENLYDKIINDENLKFAPEDIEKINQLLKSEINDDTLKNINEFTPKITKLEKKPTHKEILENFVTSYTINQNISFTSEDVNALYKIINVEIDNDFITDLRTNPERIKEMQLEIEKRKEHIHKTTELLTLNVKDMLPDLSVALKQQGGKQIKSEYKPQTVYFAEGYEVTTLNVDDELPDLTLEIHNKDAYISRPSDKVQYIENGYDVDTIKLDDEFVDLNHMFDNPEKYEKEENTQTIIDEDALLNNITNVSFKPFYNENSEVENKIEQDITVNTIKSENNIKVKDDNKIIAHIQTCNLDGELFNVVSQVNFSEQIGCYLAKNENGYTVLSYINNKIEKLKHYNTLKTENIQARLSEKLDDTTSRYIVRIGEHKFILNVSKSSLEYVLDLC